jgi:hypothetical protein
MIWVCICSVRYPACKAHAPYCHLWSVRLCIILPHCLMHRTVLGEKLFIIKCMFRFLPEILSETFLILRRTERHMITTVYFSSQKLQCRYYCAISTKTLSPQQIFEKYSNTKFHENPSGLSRVVPCGRTDETRLSRFS